MGDDLKRFIQLQSEKEAARIMEQVNQDPSLKDVHAPESLHDALFAQIEAYENEKAKKELSEEDKELIRLGKLMKKRRKNRKYVAAAAMALCAVSVTGITAIGGPERLIEKVNWMLAGREQTNLDSENDRVEQMEGVQEAEVFAKIQEAFGFEPVKMYYKPEGMQLTESNIYKDVQLINLVYDNGEGGMVAYIIQPNYRTGSASDDFEDDLLEKTKIMKSGIEIFINKYQVEENSSYRWNILFQSENTFYNIKIIGLKEAEVNQIVEGLYFP